MAQIPIKRSIERVPGGMMIVPLLAGSLIATTAPVSAERSPELPGKMIEIGASAAERPLRLRPARNVSRARVSRI